MAAKRKKIHQMAYMLLCSFFLYNICQCLCKLTTELAYLSKVCCLKLRSLSNINWSLKYYISFYRDMSGSNIVTFSCQWRISTWWRCLYPTGQGVSSNINGNVDHFWTRIARHQSAWRAIKFGCEVVK